MSDILQLINTPPAGSYVESGMILESVGDRRYRVRVNSREVLIRAATPEGEDDHLVPGAQVIVNRVGAHRYIIAATRQMRTPRKQEIVING